MIHSKSQVAKRIKEARESKGITQVSMAKILNVARQTYLDIENGKTEPRVCTLSTIAEITQIPLTWFVYGESNIGLPDAQYMHDINRLLDHLSKLPYSARSEIINYSANMASLIVNYAIPAKDNSTSNSDQKL